MNAPAPLEAIRVRVMHGKQHGPFGVAVVHAESGASVGLIVAGGGFIAAISGLRISEECNVQRFRTGPDGKPPVVPGAGRSEFRPDDAEPAKEWIRIRRVA